jgi:hypothetical protein
MSELSHEVKVRRAGVRKDGLFCPGIFHNECQRGIFTLEQEGDINNIERVTYPDGHVEYIFWDEASLACPAGFTLEDAQALFKIYVDLLEGNV